MTWSLSEGYKPYSESEARNVEAKHCVVKVKRFMGMAWYVLLRNLAIRQWKIENGKTEV